MGYISLPSILNGIIDLTSYYCVILKMVILHDAIKTIQNFFSIFLKIEQNPAYLKKCIFFKKTKKGGLFFFEKKWVFLNPHHAATMEPADRKFHS